MKNSFILAAVLLFSSLLSFAKTHTLKKGETLASVARMYYGEPAFGPKGTLNKIYKLNPGLKTNPNAVEPGIQIVLEDGTEKKTIKKNIIKMDFKEEAAGLKVAELPAPSAKDVAIEAPVAPEEPPPLTRVESEPPPPTPVAETLPPPQEAPVKAEKPAPVTEEVSARKSHFLLIPSSTQTKVASTRENTASTLDFNSSSGFGGKVGWDQTWSTSFSTLLTYEFKQLKSDVTSSVTGNKVIDSVDLFRYDLAFFNSIGRRSKMGFGLTYVKDFFIEINESTGDATSLTHEMSAPFIAADFYLGSIGKSKLHGSAKITALGADLGSHNIKKSYASQVGFAFERPMGKSVHWTAGLFYEVNNQALQHMTQKREDTSIELGFIF